MTWNRRASDAWTDAAFRAPVLTYMHSFVELHGWVEHGAWDVTERFADNGINVRVPRTPPVQPPNEADFKQRPGMRLLILGVTRTRDQRRFETALSFPDGATTLPVELAVLLDLAGRSLEVEHARSLS